MRDLFVALGVIACVACFWFMLLMAFIPSTGATIGAFVSLGIMGLAYLFIDEEN